MRAESSQMSSFPPPLEKMTFGLLHCLGEDFVVLEDLFLDIMRSFLVSGGAGQL
jgi:hypothetical protein